MSALGSLLPLEDPGLGRVLSWCRTAGAGGGERGQHLWAPLASNASVVPLVSGGAASASPTSQDPPSGVLSMKSC